MKQLRTEEDFKKARFKEFIKRVSFFGRKEKLALLSLEEVKQYLRPDSERYLGLRELDVSKIIGSEGRYQDFDRYFLPRSNFLKERWKRVDQAYHDLINLPPVSVYKIGNYYFIRDGNHRISVAKLQGAKYIDAEVIELNSKIELTQDMTAKEIKLAVIDFEKKQFIEDFKQFNTINFNLLSFTTVGGFEKIRYHIVMHKYFINQGIETEIPFADALKSWYETLFLKIVDVVQKEKILQNFPDRTYGDFYLWAINHWDNLKKAGEELTLESAAVNYVETQNIVQTQGLFKKLYDKIKG